MRHDLRGRTLRRLLWAMLVVLTLAAATGCQAAEEAPAAAKPTALETTAIRVGSETFEVEVAADPETRFRGLSGRDRIDPHGGMLFVLPRPQTFHMVMRDCPNPIDVAFLDAMGRVVAVHEMVPEPPRRSSETPFGYEQRLPAYGSGAAVQFALETAGGRLSELGVKPGDRLHFAAQDWIMRAR